MKKEILNNFIVLEGGDGSGTTTQMELLGKQFLSGKNTPPFPPLYNTFEPTDGPMGKLIRSALRGDASFLPETLALLFAGDRHEHLYAAGGIAQRCRRGELVACDRYMLSSLVYQGITCGEAFPRLLNDPFPFPELTLFFDIDPEGAQKRLGNRPVKDIYEYLDFQIQVQEGYRRALAWYRDQGGRVEIIDASREPGEVAEAVWRIIQKLPIMEGRRDHRGETEGEV
ncbi:MAG: dTMP kinase [Treponema sp.]|jgi:dTMP kinase|nr:dTMP kinase [Treponema sp.]